MGIGDEIMAAGVAEALGVPVAIVDEAGRPREHAIWDRNPAIDPTSDVTLCDCPGHRGYMLRWDDGPRAVFNPTYRNRDHPGRIYPPETAREWARHNVPEGCVIIEPNVFRPSSINKDWGFVRWQAAAREFTNVVQCCEDFGRPLLDGATHIKTPTFWHAAAAIERAAVVLTPEGGMHHMAGALGKPAAVIYGGFTHPDTTGYDGHTNLFVGDEACGRYDLCPHCRDALAMISVEKVVQAGYDLM